MIHSLSGLNIHVWLSHPTDLCGRGTVGSGVRPLLPSSAASILTHLLVAFISLCFFGCTIALEELKLQFLEGVEKKKEYIYIFLYFLAY